MRHEKIHKLLRSKVDIVLYVQLVNNTITYCSMCVYGSLTEIPSDPAMMTAVVMSQNNP